MAHPIVRQDGVSGVDGLLGCDSAEARTGPLSSCELLDGGVTCARKRYQSFCSPGSYVPE
jgi:hypothetical protein